ncbi:MAG: MTH938/NDUFAF3 family protein [Candidatus Dormiibacterota bacterium]
MQIDSFSFGSVRVDGHTYHHDLVIDRGRVRERRKGASKRHRESYGHTPLSAEEEIPWNCRRLVIGTGAAGALPVMEAVRAEAHRRHVELVMLPTERAIDLLAGDAKDTNAILHVTC